MLVRCRTGRDPTVEELPRGGRLAAAAEWRLELCYRSIGATDLLYPIAWRQLINHPAVVAADVIQLHKLQGWQFPLRRLPALTDLKPVVWRLPDMWAVTGYCYQSLGCDRWRSGCGNCPQMDSDAPIPITRPVQPRLDLTAALWRQKQAVYARSRFVVVTPSLWLEQIARASPLLEGIEVRRIPSAVNTTIYNRASRAAVRRDLEISNSTRLVLFLTGKGNAEFQAALGSLGASADVAVLIVGEDAGRVFVPAGFRSIRKPAIRNDHEMAGCFAAADVFVLPTRADNFPSTVLESMACGTPVVAFDVGGLGELVQTGRTGYLVEDGNHRDLAERVRHLIEHRADRDRLGAEAQALVAERYVPERQAEAYSCLYRELVTARPSRRS
jgi:glycosyltransferase involved in cell wall biosynthesis